MINKVYKYILEANDLELFEKNKLLIVTSQKRIILSGLKSEFIDECFEMFGKKFRKNNYKKKYSKTSWSNDEIDYLKENYFKKEMKNIGININKSNYQINLMLVKLKLLIKKEWSNDEIEFLKNNIDGSNIWLAEKLNRSVASIKAKKRVLNS